MAAKDLTTERWKPIPGWEGYYSVSDRGRVRGEARVVERSDGRRQALEGRVLRPRSRHDCRHLQVLLCRDGGATPALIHRLVLEAFVGPCPEGMETRHLNGDATDNRLENLRWGTPKENAEDSARHGTLARGETSGRSKLTRGAVRVICRLAVGGRVPQRWLAEQFGVSRATVSLIKLGKSWGHATEDLRGT